MYSPLLPFYHTYRTRIGIITEKGSVVPGWIEKDPIVIDRTPSEYENFLWIAIHKDDLGKLGSVLYNQDLLTEVVGLNNEDDVPGDWEAKCNNLVMACVDAKYFLYEDEILFLENRMGVMYR